MGLNPLFCLLAERCLTVVCLEMDVLVELYLLVMWSAFVHNFFCCTSLSFIAFLSLFHEENWIMNFLIMLAVILLTLVFTSIGLSLHIRL